MTDAGGPRDRIWRIIGTVRLCSVRDGEIHVLALAGELDLATTIEVEQELLRIEAGDADSIALDLRALEFMDSSGLKLILNAYQRSAGRLTIVKGSEQVQRLFELCDLLDELPLVDALPPEGVAALASAPPPPLDDRRDSDLGDGAAQMFASASAAFSETDAAVIAAADKLRPRGTPGAIS